MDDAAFWHRLQFGFTVSFHYLFPQVTMGLAPFLVAWKWLAVFRQKAQYATAGRFWARIFGINFAVGVVTGIPMEFQFGTNWSSFSSFSGGVIGQTLAMEGMFAFFLESALVGAMVWGEDRMKPRAHFLVTLGVALGSWLSGYFILTTHAFMEHPAGYMLTEGKLELADLAAFLLNPWALVEYTHNMTAALVTGSFVVAAVGALYLLRGTHRTQGELFLNWGTAVGLAACLLVVVPTGDQQAKMVARHQEVSLAAMEGRFESGTHAPITLIGQPDMLHERLANPIHVPSALSFLAYGTFHSNVRGLKDFPKDDRPQNIPLLYYAFHIMAGLGTLFILLMALANLQRYRGRLAETRWLLWALMLALPFPFIATTAGWMTAELGRQPWLVYGMYRTSQGYSRQVVDGDVLFTLLGFAGLYFVLGLLYLGLVGRDVLHGPQEATEAGTPGARHG
jgi:cytochrome d ubiquinol oxidase subunit I